MGMKALGALPRSSKLFSALGVAAAIAIAVNANILVSRFYVRWDLTTDRLYTLSPATDSILTGLNENVEISVLLTRTDPLLPPLRQMLAAYGERTRKLVVSYIDPEQEPARFLAFSQKHRIAAGRADDGRVITDAVLVISRGERTWFVVADELASYDDEGRAEPRLEQALSEGIANVISGERARVCFASGHGEASLSDVGPEGLSELAKRLEKSNFEAEVVDLTRADADQALKACRVLVIAGQEVPYADAATERAVRHVTNGGGLLLFTSPLFGEGTRVVRSGLEPLAKLAGVELGADIVLETDEAARLPRGTGEVFFAAPVEHAVTRGLIREGGKIDFRVVVSEARSLLLSGDARPLLHTSSGALALDDVAPLLAGSPAPAGMTPALRVLAAATELPKKPGSSAAHGARVIVAGASNLPWGRSFRDPGLVGDKLFVENAFSWVAARPAVVSIPSRKAREVGLALTEESLGEVLRYVLIYMPGAAAFSGLLVLYRRRTLERRSRKAAEES
jgi:hypothetical protein